MMSMEKMRWGTWGVAMLAVVPHIFTCVLPTVAAVLGTTGLLGTAWMHTPLGHLFMAYHMPLLIVATLAAVVGFISTVVRYACGCGPSCACGPACDCATASRGGRGALVFSALLLLLVGASWLAAPWKHADHMTTMAGHDMTPADHAAMPPMDHMTHGAMPVAPVTSSDAPQNGMPMDETPYHEHAM